MSLATRCSACSTVFRVVQEQLQVSEGWVRCGRCDAVFNALERLFDLDREAPADWDEPIPDEPIPPEPMPPDPGRVPEPADEPSRQDDPVLAAADPARPEPAPRVEAEPAAPGSEPPFADPVDTHLFGPRKRAEKPNPAGQVGARDRLEFSDARFDSDLFEEAASIPAATLLDDHESTVAADLPLETTMQPDFVRRAERRARWRSTPVRAALGTACLAALLALVLQVAHHGRDLIAAEWPTLRPALQTWCASAGCTLAAPRRIADVLLESSALTRTPGLDAFVLSVTLRNGGPFALTLPWVDLNLTDGNGRLVARRALGPRDFGAAEVIQAGAETALRLTMSAGPATVAGYTVEIFYP